jgi:drug/metabolite transporter (DMT)-like permease
VPSVIPSTLASFALRPAQRQLHTLLAWYFVAIWGSGFIASKIGMQHAAPFTSVVYRTPAFAIVPEFFWFGITPSTVSWAGIVITCMGVGLVVWRRENRAA